MIKIDLLQILFCILAEIIFKLYRTENSKVVEGDREVSLRSSSQQPPGNVAICQMRSSRESNPSRRVCHLPAIPLGHVAGGQVVDQERIYNYFKEKMPHKYQITFNFPSAGGTIILRGGSGKIFAKLHTQPLYPFVCPLSAVNLNSACKLLHPGFCQ